MSVQNVVNDRYFNWLYDYVCKSKSHDKVSYRRLFMTLHDVDFIFSIPNDINRAKDGLNLRYRFSLSYPDESVDVLEILNRPCSVLEMMIALAIRCEEEIMDDSEYGNRTSQWFWGMIKNLGIGLMTDDVYDPIHIKDMINIFMNREYDSDGKGGLFYIKNCQDDLRDHEIWTQLCWYLDKIY